MTDLRIRRRIAALGLLLLTAALGGCGVVSETPLFSPDVRPQEALAEGLWALSGPGCDLSPTAAGALPDCAVPVIVTPGRMSWDPGSFLAGMTGSRALAAMPLPKTSAYVLVDGEPRLIELLNGPTNQTPPPPPGELPRPPLKPSYLALRVLQTDGQGRIVRGVLWPVACPPPGRALSPGLDRVGGQCVARTAAAVVAQAKSPPPFQSAFLTWISATAEPPAQVR